METTAQQESDIKSLEICLVKRVGLVCLDLAGTIILIHKNVNKAKILCIQSVTFKFVFYHLPDIRDLPVKKLIGKSSKATAEKNTFYYLFDFVQ